MKSINVNEQENKTRTTHWSFAAYLLDEGVNLVDIRVDFVLVNQSFNAVDDFVEPLEQFLAFQETFVF